MWPLTSVPGIASTASVSDWPTFTHGAIFSGTSAVSFSGSILTSDITAVCVLTNSPGDTRRFWT